MIGTNGAAAAGLMMKARGPKHENNNRNFLLLIVALVLHFIYLLQRENAAGYYMSWLCVDNVGISLTIADVYVMTQPTH
jgi:hypothetical protein